MLNLVPIFPKEVDKKEIYSSSYIWTSCSNMFWMALKWLERNGQMWNVENIISNRSNDLMESVIGFQKSHYIL